MKDERQMEALIQERRNVMSSLGIKYDALAQTGQVGEEDRAQISNDEFVSIRINSLDTGKLRLINEALRRIQDGDYGRCLHCEELIPARRLEIIPWAEYCVQCQEHLSLMNSRAVEEEYALDM